MLGKTWAKRNQPTARKMFGSAARKLAGTARKILQNPPTIMTQLWARRLCQSAVWWTSLPQKRPLRRDKPCPRTELLQPISTLHGKLHWRARRASQKPAGETPCIGSEKVSKAAMPDACRATHFCSPRQNAKLGNEQISETNPQNILRRPNGLHQRRFAENQVSKRDQNFERVKPV